MCQQRLLIITIFSVGLRDIAKNSDVNTSQLIKRQDISFEDREGGETYRIVPGESIANYFEKKYSKYNSKPLEATYKNTTEKSKIEG